MAPSLQIQGAIILIWLLILSAGVSSFGNECWSFLCVTDPSLNCTCKPEVPNWLITTICIVPLVMIGICCIKICITYYKEREGIRLADGSSLPSPPPLPITDMISIHHFELRMPPTYNEAISRQQHCPLALDDPPAYENIAMRCISSPDVSIPAGFMPRNNTTIV